ncbi:Nucleobase-ascorbate transporter 12 [Holothuria leucospilota]|uniref:Nucleobase-ascorbate transporter 12 n=1 Tax=Holothuria leucospilota TaxID=206669 RepID=A0A9Q1C4G6_HOLLE|nr:Nucleobase-ascorbate transporter 12 [Holothuria leucospilota]
MSKVIAKKCNSSLRFVTLVIFNVFLQPFISLIGSLILLPVLISEILCFRDEIVVLSKIISASILFQGVITLLQSTFGIRLPITQGCSFSFIPPAIALMSFYGGCSDEEGKSS